MRMIVICLGLLLMSSAVGADGSGVSLRSGPAMLKERRFLPVDEAFQLTAIRENNAIVLRWQIMPGYYLYRHRLSFALPGGEVGEPGIMPGEPKHDEYFGDVEVYYEELSVTLPLVDAGGESSTLIVGYQGCADAGLCYPPQKRQLLLENL